MASSSVYLNTKKRAGFVNPDKNAFIAYVKDDGNKFKVAVVSAEAGMPISDGLSYDSGKDLIEAIPLFTRFKAVILNICDSKNYGFSNSYVFCEAVRAELKKHNIKHMFTSMPHFLMSTLIVNANVQVDIGDTILSCVYSSNNIVCTEFRFTKRGYALLGFKKLDIDLKKSHQDIREEILGSLTSSEPSKILLSAVLPNDPMIKSIKNILDSKNVVEVKSRIDAATWTTVVELYKRMIDKSYVKNYILPTSPREYRLGFIMGKRFYRCIGASCHDALPFSDTKCIPRSSLEWAVTFTNSDTLEPVYLQRFAFPENGHRFNVTFNVDEDGCPSYEFEPIVMDDLVTCIPEKLNRTGMKIPVISFFDNSSVISVYREGKGYEFLESWGGVLGSELLIAFDKSKPTFFKDAADAHRNKPSSVITDITELMANPAERLTFECPFKITKDDKNPVLIEFDNFDGTRKAATPVFLMALFLKQHIKALKADGFEEEQLKNIGFHFITFHKYREYEKWKQLQKNMKETCALLKINWNEETQINI